METVVAAGDDLSRSTLAFGTHPVGILTKHVHIVQDAWLTVLTSPQRFEGRSTLRT